MKHQIRPSVFVLSLALSVATVLVAQAEAPSDITAPQVVVLQNGGVVQGRVEKSRDGLRVTNGPWYAVNVPRDDVDFVADDMPEVYRVKLDRIRAGDFDGHVKLAYWCLRYNMDTKAADRLLYLSNLDPFNPAIAALESQLRQRASRGLTDANVKLASVEQPIEPVSAQPAVPVQAIDPDSVGEFTRTIQPLILNRCGQTTCHGNASRNAFHLTRLNSSGSARRDLTLRNLNAVMKYVGSGPVTQTRLYERATLAHGRAIRAPIESHEVRQLRRLAGWIASTTGQQIMPLANAADDSVSPPPPGTAADPLTRLQNAMQDVDKTNTVARSSRVDSTSPSATLTDPYDPNSFNRRFHGDDEIDAEIAASFPLDEESDSTEEAYADEYGDERAAALDADFSEPRRF